jgi:hypothetical protein
VRRDHILGSEGSRVFVATIVFNSPLMSMKAVTRLFREPSNAIGNRQPDHDHVHKQPENQVMKFVRTPGVERGERQDDKIHYLFNGGAKEQATHQWVFRQETQPAAGRVVKQPLPSKR